MHTSHYIPYVLVALNALAWAIVAWLLWPRAPAPDMYRLAPHELACADIAGWLLCVT